jgi:hypothetical protein
MAIIKEFIYSGTTVSLSNEEFNLAIKNAKTHDFELKIEKINEEIDNKNNYIYNLYKCKKCGIKVGSYGENRPLWLNEKILYLTCEEVIIKGIIE